MRLTLSLPRAAKICGSRTASVFGERRRTWNELHERVARLAGVLRDLGVRDGARAAILSHSSDRWLESAYATVWAGGVIVPLSTRANAQELALLLADVEAEVLLISDDFLALLPELRAHVRHVVHLGEGPTPPGPVDYEAAIAARRQSRTPRDRATISPRSSSPAAPRRAERA